MLFLAILCHFMHKVAILPSYNIYKVCVRINMGSNKRREKGEMKGEVVFKDSLYLKAIPKIEGRDGPI